MIARIILTLEREIWSGKFSGKQRISLFTNFPLHVNEGKLVDKEIFCLPLNFPLPYHTHEGNLEDKG